MPEQEREEGVYGENMPAGEGHTDRGIREQTLEAHPQPTGDAASNPDGADAASEVRARGAEAVESSAGSVAQDLEDVRNAAAQDTGSGGMGRDGTPRNPADTPQGVYQPTDEERPNTPG